MSLGQAQAFDAQLKTLGEDVVYTLEDDSVLPQMRAIIERGVDDTGQEGQITNNQIIVAVRLSDLPRIPKKNDLIAVTDTGEEFTVRKLRSKNAVFCRLLMTE